MTRRKSSWERCIGRARRSFLRPTRSCDSEIHPDPSSSITCTPCAHHQLHTVGTSAAHRVHAISCTPCARHQLHTVCTPRPISTACVLAVALVEHAGGCIFCGGVRFRTLKRDVRTV